MAISEHLDLLERSSGRAVVLDPLGIKSIKADHNAGGRMNEDGSFGEITRLPPRAKRRCETIPVALIDKSALFRAGLRHILSGSRFRVVAECNRLSELSAIALGDKPAVALVGLDNDFDAILRGIWSLKEKNRNIRFIVLSERMDPGQGMALIESGSDAYLLRNEIGPDVVLKSLELVLVEGVVIPHGFTKLLSDMAPWHIAGPAPDRASGGVSDDGRPEARGPEEGPPMPDAGVTENCGLRRLSDRERLILVHLTQGASNKHIARDLNIAEATVKAHVKSLLRKIRVNNRTQAAMWAINHAHADGQKSPSRLPT